MNPLSMVSLASRRRHIGGADTREAYLVTASSVMALSTEDSGPVLPTRHHSAAGIFVILKTLHLQTAMRDGGDAIPFSKWGESCFWGSL